jgi:hypothetical protein
MCGRVVQKTPLSEIRVLFETVNPILNSNSTSMPRRYRCYEWSGVARSAILPKASSIRKGGGRSTCCKGPASLLGQRRHHRLALRQRNGRDRCHETGVPKRRCTLISFASLRFRSGLPRSR